MGWMQWVPGVTSTALLAGVMWLGRKLISERLTASVKYEFDGKLEILRAEIRAGEERLTSVRSAAMAALSRGQAALNQRRMQAIDDLWRGTMAYKTGTGLVQVMGRFRIDQVAKEMHDPATQKVVDLFEMFGQGLVDRIREANPEKARPYVSPMAWALFTAYSSIISVALLMVQALKARMDVSKVVKQQATVDIVKTALPEYAALLDEDGAAALHTLLPALEEKILAELRACLEGRDQDPEAVVRAAKVIGLVAAQEEQLRGKAEAFGLPP
jgi:hypothetical protein